MSNVLEVQTLAEGLRLLEGFYSWRLKKQSHVWLETFLKGTGKDFTSRDGRLPGFLPGAAGRGRGPPAAAGEPGAAAFGGARRPRQAARHVALGAGGRWGAFSSGNGLG